MENEQCTVHCTLRQMEEGNCECWNKLLEEWHEQQEEQEVEEDG